QIRNLKDLWKFAALNRNSTNVFKSSPFYIKEAATDIYTFTPRIDRDEEERLGALLRKLYIPGGISYKRPLNFRTSLFSVLPSVGYRGGLISGTKPTDLLKAAFDPYFRTLPVIDSLKFFSGVFHNKYHAGYTAMSHFYDSYRTCSSQ